MRFHYVPSTYRGRKFGKGFVERPTEAVHVFVVVVSMIM